ncbi:MAG TPA: twin-arginine translocation signal domain-containing protein, partial [Planctomycetaceae bacterium]|nr:twin-arginine translocation signal domain-containing protein [Planctomycetaceae bacterium]
MLPARVGLTFRTASKWFQEVVMNGTNVSRRGFLKRASAATAVAATGAVGAYGVAGPRAEKLAALGGTPVRSKPFTPWPPAD